MRIIDQTDRAILRMLRSDARASVTTMANELNLTRATVTSRITALRDDGVILRFTIETDGRAEGDPIEAISLIAVTSQRNIPVQRTIQRMTAVSRLFSTNGKWDLVAHTQSRDLSDFDKTLNDIGQISGVERVETCLLLTRLA